jgi:hypothetical protein
MDPNEIEKLISVWRFALGITQEPAARLPYLATTRDRLSRCARAKWLLQHSLRDCVFYSAH